MESNLVKPQKTIILCSAFILGTAIFLSGFNIYFLALAVILLLFLVLKHFISARFLFVCIAVIIFSIIYADFRKPAPDGLYALSSIKTFLKKQTKSSAKPKLRKILSPQLVLKGRVLNEPAKNLKDKTKFYFKAHSFKNNGDWLAIKAKTLVYIYDKDRKFENIKTGDILELEGSVNRPFHATNPGQFDYEKYLNNKGAFTMTYVRGDAYQIIERPASGRWFLINQINELKNHIIEIHKKNLESPKLEILGGMVFGDYAVPTPDKIEKEFIKSGLLHLLAASGMNVGIIFGTWFFIASKASVPFRLNIIIGMVLVGIYSLLTGLPPSVTRSALMLEFILFGKLLERKADNVGLLVLVCALMLLFDPLMLLNVGFQLSFIVTLGLLICIPILVKKVKPVPELLSGIILVPLVAQIFAAPIQIFHFNNFAVYSLFANMAVISFVGIITCSGFLGSILSLIPIIGEKLCFLADKAAEPFIMLLLFVSGFVAKLPNSLQYVAAPEQAVVILLYIFLILSIFAIKNNFSAKNLNSAILIIVFALLVFVFKNSFITDKNLEFMFFSVGEGDSLLLKTPDKKYMLIDTGPFWGYSPAKTTIVPFLRDKGIKKLDAIVLTHPDSDHTGGTLYILKNIEVEKIFNNGVKDNSKTSRSIRRYIRENNLHSEVLKDGDVINPDNELKIRVIRPDNTNSRNDNEDSLILYIVYRDFSALLMADCEAESLDKIKKIVLKPVNLLKVGHHGSKGSVSDDFLEYLKPKISVISTGEKGYRRQHPHNEVIGLLKKYNSKIFRTDRDFAITITTDGYETDFKTFRNSR